MAGEFEELLFDRRTTLTTGTPDCAHNHFVVIECVVNVAADFAHVESPERMAARLKVWSACARQDRKNPHCGFEFGGK